MMQSLNQKSSSRLSLDIYPAIGLGIFSLGMTIRTVISKMKEPQNSVARFDLKYCKEDPLATHICLDLIEDGVLFRFDPASQKLLSIEIYDATKLNISYNTNLFCSSDVKPTFEQVYKTFGPTHPGKFDDAHDTYELVYPGLVLAFNVANVKKKSITELPLKNVDGTSPIASRITIVESSIRSKTNNSNNMNSNSSAQTSSSSSSSSSSSLDEEEVIAKIGYGIELHGGDVLTFDSTTQDVLSILGQPNRIYTKLDDKLKIHSQSASATPTNDYFFNYFDLGIDVLFDSQRHSAKKFVLHTNSPHNVDFNCYSKCMFKLLNSSNNVSVGPDEHFDLVKAALKLESDPLVQMTAFGVVLYYGMPGVVFEVAQINKCILSVTLFEQ